MTSSITTRFIKAFDPKNEIHINWLQDMTTMAEGMTDPTAHINLIENINANPMKVTLDKRDALDWPHVHFVLMAVYAKAVMKGQAFVPTH